MMSNHREQAQSSLQMSTLLMCFLIVSGCTYFGIGDRDRLVTKNLQIIVKMDPSKNVEVEIPRIFLHSPNQSIGLPGNLEVILEGPDGHTITSNYYDQMLAFFDKQPDYRTSINRHLFVPLNDETHWLSIDAVTVRIVGKDEILARAKISDIEVVDSDLFNPKPYNQTAVLIFELDVAHGYVVSHKLVDIEVNNVVGPRVNKRRTGDWKVGFDGSTRESFEVQLPTRVEIFPHDAGPYWQDLSGKQSYRLIVPLYEDNALTKFESIVVTDTETGDIVAKVPKRKLKAR